MNDKRTKLIQATIALVAERGFSAATAEAISRKAKVAKSLVYYYFKRKEDIFSTIVVEKLNSYFDFLENVHPIPSASWDNESYAEAHIAFVEQNRENLLYFYKYFDEYAHDKEFAMPVHRFVSKWQIVLQNILDIRAGDEHSVERVRVRLMSIISVINGSNRLFLNGIISKEESKAILLETLTALSQPASFNI